MLEYKEIEKKTLPFIKENGRMLDYYLILNLFNDGDYDELVLEELIKYRNDDLGFGNGLEPDNQSPSSSVLATDIATSILETITCEKKYDFISGIVKFYESQFKKDSRTFNFINDDICKYPHAIWWNKESISSFGYFNPNPEVVGLLYKYRKYVKSLDIVKLVEEMLTKIKSSEFKDTDSEHSLYSVVRFYNYIDSKYQMEIENIIYDKIRELICLDKEKWVQYQPQPYKMIPSKCHPLYDDYKECINENMQFLMDSMNENCVWYPEWQWYQYDNVFENKARHQWMGYVTYERLRFFKEFNFIKY